MKQHYFSKWRKNEVISRLFVDRCLSFCTFPSGHCVVCPFLSYGFFLLPLWYLQAILIQNGRQRTTGVKVFRKTNNGLWLAANSEVNLTETNKPIHLLYAMNDLYMASKETLNFSADLKSKMTATTALTSSLILDTGSYM